MLRSARLQPSHDERLDTLCDDAPQHFDGGGGSGTTACRLYGEAQWAEDFLKSLDALERVAPKPMCRVTRAIIAKMGSAVRRRVQSAIDDLGYETDVVAQSLRGGSTKMIACAIRDFDISQFAACIKEAERIFRENGYTLLLSSTTNRPDVEMALLRAFKRRRVDGIMMTISDEAHAGVAKSLVDVGVPVLLIDRDHIETLDRVTVDHFGGVDTATRYLLKLGHRRIALLVGDVKAFPSRSRVEGFQAAFAAGKHKVDPSLLRQGVLDQEGAFRETVALLSLPDPPTALLVAAMDTLGGTLRALRLLNREVGRDVSLITGSDSDLAELYSPGVSAIRWDLAEMGRHAATMLLERISGRSSQSSRAIKLPSMLVIRQSCQAVS